MPQKQIGPYRLERPLGQGGMGTVFEGVHQDTGERAAIKMLSEGLATDPRFRERFLGEVETLKKLRHEHIVTLRGYGEAEGRLFFVMELVDGPSLETELRRGRRYTWREVVQIAVQICAALKHAHDHGVIHRDLKPANLLQTADGTVKLTDFGIAKFFGSTGLTMAGGIIGTPEYMSPEQTEGRAVTSRSDLYSLGCVLYSLLAGRPPFAARSITQVIDAVRFEQPPRLQSIAPEVPPALDEIIAQLLRKNPEDRIATPQTLANLLLAMQHVLETEDDIEELPSGSSSTSAGTRVAVERPGDSEEPAETPPTGERPTIDFVIPTQAPAPAPGVAVQPAGTACAATWNGTNVAADELQLAPLEKPQDHFTTVSEEDWRRQLEQPDARPFSRRDWLAVLGLAAILLLLVAGVTIVFWPPSADRLYLRIRGLSEQTPWPDNYPSVLEEFLTRFPQDTRAPEVCRLRDEYLCGQLRDELQHKLRSLTELEKRFLKALDFLDAGQFADAEESFSAIVSACHENAFNLRDQKLLEQSQFLADKARRLASDAEARVPEPR